jgi:hypothetical protein
MEEIWELARQIQQSPKPYHTLAATLAGTKRHPGVHAPSHYQTFPVPVGTRRR